MQTNNQKQPAAPEPIRRRKLAHEVRDRLLTRIRNGDFPVGSILPSERELMQFFSVGRPAVREALQELERMGFISIVHGEGARVMPLTAATVIGQISEASRHLLSTSEDLLEHFKEARQAFEVGMVSTAIDRATEEDLRVLHQALEANRQSTDDTVRFHETDMNFHRAIADISRNPIFSAVSEAILASLEQFYSDLVWNPGREQMVLNEHQKIYERICARDKEGAARAMIEHLTRANQRYKTAQQ